MYTTQELREKLRREGYPETVIQETLTLLSEKGYLDDWQYTSTYVEEKRQTAPRGYFAFLYELRRRGVSLELLRELRSVYPLEAEVEDARRLIFQWKATKSEREKCWRRLSRKGFSPEAIERAVLDLPDPGS